MDENPPAKAEDLGFHPRSGMIPQAAQLSACTTATESVLQSLGARTTEPMSYNSGNSHAREPMLHNKRSHQNDSPVHCNGNSSSHSPQLEKSPQQS